MNWLRRNKFLSRVWGFPKAGMAAIGRLLALDHWDRKNKEHIFQDCLAEIQERGGDLNEVLSRYPKYESEFRPRLEEAIWLKRQVENIEPRPGFVEASHRRLLNSIMFDKPAFTFSRLVNRLSTVVRQRRFKNAVNLLAVLILGVSLISIARQTISWAQTSLPGDGVYLVKLLVEDLKLALTFDPIKQAKLRIDFAQERSNEIQALILEDRYEQIPISAVDFLSQVYQAEQILGTIQTKDQATALKLSERLNVIIDDQYTILAVLIDVVPARARSAIEQAMILAP